MGGQAEVSSIDNAAGARALLAADRSPATVRAVALRAEELRVYRPQDAVGIAEAALEAQTRLPPAQRRPRLVALTWYLYGSACRAASRFDEAELALLIAARVLPRWDTRSQAEVLRRLAYLRADQRRAEACELMARVVEFWRPAGGVELGKRLAAASAILYRFRNYDQSAANAEEALTLLPPNGDRFHLSAVFNLASSLVELSCTEEELDAAAEHVAEVHRLVEPGTLPEAKSHWLTGKLLQRRGRFADAIAAMETASDGIDQLSDGFDQALLLVDLAETHLEAGDQEASRRRALTSFRALHSLPIESEAYRPMRLFHQAASDQTLDLATVRSVRSALLASRRTPH